MFAFIVHVTVYSCVCAHVYAMSIMTVCVHRWGCLRAYVHVWCACVFTSTQARVCKYIYV
jgi:hypothetical protein